MDQRLQILRSWLDTVVNAPSYQLHAASSDASFRRYFRVCTAEHSYIAMDAPPDKYDSGIYIRVAEYLLSVGLNVPRLVHSDLHHGFLLLTDLGDQLYLTQLNDGTVERLYGDAMRALRVLQTAKPLIPGLRAYDQDLLLTEMKLFGEWYLEHHLRIHLTPKQRRILDRTFHTLAQRASEQPTVLVHRDYHSRNLIVTPKNNPGIVDFQDAVRGPVTYDLVSLLCDCYISWPRQEVERWVAGYHAAAKRSGIPICEAAGEFLAWFDWMGVQRHLKAVGIFARLRHRDDKPNYIADIPRTLDYVLEVSERYAELRPLRELLRELEVPPGTEGGGVT
ncbi:MAG: aminoglycoside phosphotransferase family protein [Acidiferrobacterales bacterium]